jgi:cytochrome c556
MRESYIFEKKLTKAQEVELSKLPGELRALDEGFHVRAGKLAHAAMAKDAEAVSFQFSRLLDTCVACHTSYARAQFPQFGPAASEPHQH